MAWCRTGNIIHYLNQWWPKFLSKYDITRQQVINWLTAPNHYLKLLLLSYIYIYELLKMTWFFCTIIYIENLTFNTNIFQTSMVTTRVVVTSWRPYSPNDVQTLTNHTTHQLQPLGRKHFQEQMDKIPLKMTSHWNLVMFIVGTHVFCCHPFT